MSVNRYISYKSQAFMAIGKQVKWQQPFDSQGAFNCQRVTLECDHNCYGTYVA